MADFERDVVALLTKAGWHLLRRGKGDHSIWHDPATGRKVIVDGTIKSRHTANAICKSAGLGKPF